MNRYKWQAITRVALAYRDRPVAGTIIVFGMLAPWTLIGGALVALLR